MNKFVHKLINTYSSYGKSKSLRLLNELQCLLQEARHGVDEDFNQKQFHQKFILFLEGFGYVTDSVHEVYFRYKENGALWIKLSDNSQIAFRRDEEINKITAQNDFFIFNNNPDYKNFLQENSFAAHKNNTVIFQLFGFCDYLVILKEGINKRHTMQAINLLSGMINQIKQIDKESSVRQESKFKIEQLEKKLVLKEKSLITTERNLKRRVYEIHNLLEVSNELYSILNLNQLINSAMLIVVGQLGCQKAFTFLYDVNQRKYSKRFQKGLNPVELTEFDIDVDHPLVGFFEKSNRPVLTAELKKEEALKVFCRQLDKCQIELVAPIIYGDRVQGFIGCGALLSGQSFTKNEIDIFNILVNIISVSVSNAQTYEDVKNLSLTDAMTNLNNYRYFEDRLKEEINRGRRNNTPVSLIMLDIDHFKNYNDTLGHQAGDEALRNIGWILKNTVREEDIVNRYGGEEFCIILPGIPKKVIRILGERIRAKIEQYPFYKENVQPGGKITVSLGGSCFSDDADNFEELVYKADQALYKSKNAGRNRLSICGSAE